MNIKKIDNGPIISCIVPAYNVSDYLERCINSLINQTYSNYEIIIVNDGSTDDTGEKIEKYRTHPKVTIIYQENQGLSAARNTGIAKASGSYITFVDSDDWVDRDYFNTMIVFALKYKADIVAVGHDVCSKELKDASHSNDSVVFTDFLCGDLLYSFEVTNFAWGKLFKKELISEDFFPVGRAYEDVGSIYKVYDVCKRHVKVNGSYYHYFLREGSITSERKLSHVQDRICFLKNMLSYKPGSRYRYWGFYVWVKSFAAMADLYKVKNIDSREREKYKSKIYQCAEKMNAPFKMRYIMKSQNCIRFLLMKFHLAHVVLGLKN